MRQKNPVCSGPSELVCSVQPLQSPVFFVFINNESFLNSGSVFHFGYGLGVMNQLGGDLEKIFSEKGTTMAMNFTSG